MNRSKMKPALIGGAALGVASSIPVLNLANCACCALVIGGGVLASYFYTKDAPPAPAPAYGDALLLGALTGVFGALISTMLSIPMTLLTSSMGVWEGIADALREADLPPEALELIDSLGSGGFALGALLIGLVFNLVIYSIFAGIGAMIGAAIFNKKPAAA